MYCSTSSRTTLGTGEPLCSKWREHRNLHARPDLTVVAARMLRCCMVDTPNQGSGRGYLAYCVAASPCPIAPSYFTGATAKRSDAVARPVHSAHRQEREMGLSCDLRGHLAGTHGGNLSGEQLGVYGSHTTRRGVADRRGTDGMSEGRRSHTNQDRDARPGPPMPRAVSETQVPLRASLLTDDAV